MQFAFSHIMHIIYHTLLNLYIPLQTIVLSYYFLLQLLQLYQLRQHILILWHFLTHLFYFYSILNQHLIFLLQTICQLRYLFLRFWLLNTQHLNLLLINLQSVHQGLSLQFESLHQGIVATTYNTLRHISMHNTTILPPKSTSLQPLGPNGTQRKIIMIDILILIKTLVIDIPKRSLLWHIFLRNRTLLPRYQRYILHHIFLIHYVVKFKLSS